MERAAIIKNGKDTKLHEVADKWANELGVSDIPNPTMTMDEVRELENWVGLRKCIEGGKQGWMTIAATNDKGWYVGFTTRKPTQEDDLSFITVVKPSYPSTVFLVLDLLEIFSEASEN
ncbi:hypothetical protein SL1157_2744 [Ruegeria lacuscaerulensis ITI-1157]|nr:hypothetical protein SL1157_2744 [Ruegeria lacuscaerulensis ITI-1157]